MFEHIDKDRKRLRKFLPWVDTTKTISDEENYIRMTHKKWDDLKSFNYGIFIGDSDIYTGNIEVQDIAWEHNCCDLGYWILEDFEGNGYISKAVQALEKVLFGLGFNRIQIQSDASNEKSGNVAKRNHYLFEGILRQNFIDHNNKYRNTQFYSKLLSEYKAN